MSEKPINFKAHEVLAALEGRKTQTRRVVKPAIRIAKDGGVWYPAKDARRAKHYANLDHLRRGFPTDFSHYQLGDLLWVRETWGESGFRRIEYKAHPADGEHFRCVGRWRSPIHMPRWASRLTLRVTEVRIQRVQEISRDDEVAEGAPDGMFFDCIWDSIHAKHAERCWKANPWVVALTFERV